MKYCNVIRFHAPFERIKLYNDISEVNLYKSVILQAIIDATNLSNDKSSKKIALEAKTWLVGNSEDFQFICDKANMETSFVRKIALTLIKLHERNMNKVLNDKLRKSDMRDSRKNVNEDLDSQDNKNRMFY